MHSWPKEFCPGILQTIPTWHKAGLGSTPTKRELVRGNTREKEKRLTYLIWMIFAPLSVFDRRECDLKETIEIDCLEQNAQDGFKAIQ